MNLTKKMLLSACILASGITNTVVCAELISHTPQIYIDIPSPGGEHFEKKALSLITLKDLQNCASYLGNIQQQLTEFLTKITPLASTYTHPVTKAPQLSFYKEDLPNSILEDAGRSTIITESITKFLSGIDVEDNKEIIMYNISLLITDDSDKTWIKGIIEPLKTGNVFAQNLYSELINLLKE